MFKQSFKLAVDECKEKEVPNRMEELIEAGYDEVGLIVYPDTSIWEKKGDQLLGQDNEKALHCYCEAIRIDPRDVSAWYRKGDCLYVMGKYKEAIECYDQALQINAIDYFVMTSKYPQYPDPYLVGKSAEGRIVRYYNFPNLHIFAPRILVSKGSALLVLMRYKEAIPCFEESLKCFDPHPLASVGLSVAIGEVKGPQEAISVIDKELKFRQGNTEVYKHLSLRHCPTWKDLCPDLVATTTAVLKKHRKEYCNELKIKPSNN